MNIDWTNIVILVAITIAITNRIKSELPELRSFWYTLISLGVGTALYFIGVYAPVAVTIPLTIGLVASGIYDIRQGDGQ